MALIYSTLFGDVAYTAAGANTFYTVPAGFTAILRDVDAASASATGVELDIGDLVTGLTFIQYKGTTPFTVLPPWRGRQVFPEGHAIFANATGGTFTVRMSGYLLTNP